MYVLYGPVSAILAMVAPVVLITAGGILANGQIITWGQCAQLITQLADQRATIVGKEETEDDQRRVADIDAKITILDNRLRILRKVAITLGVGIGLLILSVIFIGAAVSYNSRGLGYFAVALVIWGTVGEFAAVVMVTVEAIQRGNAARHAAKRAQWGGSGEGRTQPQGGRP